MKKALLVLVGILWLAFGQAGSAYASQLPDTILNETATKLIGTPYSWGGVSENGFDCSGFTKYVYGKFGIDLPHQSRAQDDRGYWVPKKDLRPGDLVFFNTYGNSVSHVGIYLGDDQFIHAADDGVRIDQLSERYYANRYVAARRILWDDLYSQLTKVQAVKQ